MENYRPKVKADTDERKKAVRGVSDLFGIPISNVHVNGIDINGYVAFEEMVAILEALNFEVRLKNY